MGARMLIHRREFLRASLTTGTLVSLGSSTAPLFVARSAAAVEPARARVLVVVQLLGGNDGLNTVVPFGHDGYLRGRRVLRIGGSQVHKVTPEIGLHPGLGGLGRLLDQGKLAIVQGVGYPNPDRSHFRSMEIWESGRTEPDALETGWLGRANDARPARAGEDARSLHIGAGSRPLALRAKTVETPSLESLDQFRLRLDGSEAERRIELAGLERVAQAPRSTDDALLGFIRRATVSAYETSRKLEAVAPAGSAGNGYPGFELARRLGLIAQMIKAGFGTRIYYTTLGGFDTHANQLGAHAALLTELGDSIGAFHKDLSAAGESDRVAMLVFSEFGRRVSENASQGTDHGAAAPVFVVGPVKTPGLVGAHPDLDRLVDGDLAHHTDFRRIYASLLDDWLGLPAGPIVGEGFPPLDMLPAASA